jgi:hypothetical protein
MLCKACALPWNDQCGHWSSQDRTCETTDTPAAATLDTTEVYEVSPHTRERKRAVAFKTTQLRSSNSSYSNNTAMAGNGNGNARFAAGRASKMMRLDEIEEGEVIAGFLDMREDDFLKVQLQQGGVPVGELIAFDDAVALLESEDANRDTYLRMSLPDREGRHWCSFRGDDWGNERWIVIRQRHLNMPPKQEILVLPKEHCTLPTIEGPLCMPMVMLVLVGKVR